MTLNTMNSIKDLSVNGVIVPPLLLSSATAGRESTASFRKDFKRKGNQSNINNLKHSSKNANA